MAEGATSAGTAAQERSGDPSDPRDTGEPHDPGDPRDSDGPRDPGDLGGPSGWSPADRKRVELLAETFVPGDASRRAELAMRAIDAGLPADQARRLRLALRLIELPAASLVLARRGAGFERLTQAERERVLLSWARSRIGLRRSAFQAWKRLLLFLAYADPGDGHGNPHLTEIGYLPDRPPLAATPTAVRPIDVAPPPGQTAAVDLEADVVVVGSGAGGGAVAAQLTAAGRSVVVLEAGSFVPEPEMPADELTAFDRLYLDHGLTASADGSVAILAGATVGGGTTVNWTTSIAVPDEVRAEWAREHGIDGIDGPEVGPELAAIQADLGVQPAAMLPPKDAAILRGAAALGIEAAPTQRNADACADCGSCGFGCRRGAKRSGLRSYLADACLGGARLVAGAHVERVLVHQGRVAGVEAVLDGPSGPGSGEPSGRHDPRRLVVHAHQVVLAAGALRTPVVLARSSVDHPAAGRYLRLHPVSAIAARFDEPVEAWRGPLQAARSVAFLGSGERGRGFVLEAAPAHPGLMALAFPWQSAADHAAILRQARHYAPLIAICRDRGSGRVRPAGGGHARIDYRVARADAVTLRRGLVELARLARAAGATELLALGATPERLSLAEPVGAGARESGFAAFLQRLARFDFAPNRGMVFSAHQMGTARMGADAELHACDPAGRVRADRGGRVIPGLYVADASLFPTAIGVNPMLTVILLARRVGRTVLAEA